jgi:hypothetical protein
MLERTGWSRTLTQRPDRSDWPNKQKEGIFGRVDSTGQVGQDILMQDTYTQVEHMQGSQKRKHYRQRRCEQDMTDTECVDKRFTVQFSKAVQTQNKSITRQKQFSERQDRDKRREHWLDRNDIQEGRMVVEIQAENAQVFGRSKKYSDSF